MAHGISNPLSQGQGQSNHLSRKVQLLVYLIFLGLSAATANISDFSSFHVKSSRSLQIAPVSTDTRTARVLVNSAYEIMTQS